VDERLGRADLRGWAGGPRWKQRAFYDAMKDTAPAVGMGLAVARVSIYDNVAGVLLDDVLKERAEVSAGDVRRLVAERTALSR
jgi:hypothetical protein